VSSSFLAFEIGIKAVFIHVSFGTPFLEFSQICTQEKNLLPMKVFRRVVEPQLLVRGSNLVHVLVAQLEVALQVRLYARLGLALGDDGVALRDAPGQRDLRAGFSVLLAHGGEHGVVDEFAHVFAFAVDGVGVAEGAVLGHVDAFCGVVFDEVFLLQVGVELHLVGGWDLCVGLLAVLLLLLRDKGFGWRWTYYVAFF